MCGWLLVFCVCFVGKKTVRMFVPIGGQVEEENAAVFYSMYTLIHRSIYT